MVHPTRPFACRHCSSSASTCQIRNVPSKYTQQKLMSISDKSVPLHVLGQFGVTSKMCSTMQM